MGGNLDIHYNAELKAGKLDEVKGEMYIDKTAKVSDNIIVLQVAKVL